jgi:membrane AbrB-like protein
MTGMPADLARLPGWAQWFLLIALAALLSLGLKAAGMPASQLLGPMAASILFSLGGGTVRLPRGLYIAAQGMVGCLIATQVTPEILHTFIADWPLIVAAVLSTLAASSLTGWLMTMWRVLPGTTAIWGTAPGGASAMVVMAEAFGADARLVALMQYLRVVCVAGAAALVAHYVAASLPTPPPAPWFPLIRPLDFATGLILAGGGAWLARRFRIPAGPVLVPMLIGAVLHSAGLIEIQLPPWLMAVVYGVIGCSIGLGFTRQVLARAARALPMILLSIFVLMALCALMSLGLVWLLGVDLLTAYLAMSPGGIDSVAVIGAAGQADMSFVMALQTMRLLAVILLGPPLARALSRSAGRKDARSSAGED